MEHFNIKGGWLGMHPCIKHLKRTVGCGIKNNIELQAWGQIYEYLYLAVFKYYFWIFVFIIVF